jgi:hypothetical protein
MEERPNSWAKLMSHEKMESEVDEEEAMVEALRREGRVG